jgi:hypothetical protein
VRRSAWRTAILQGISHWADGTVELVHGRQVVEARLACARCRAEALRSTSHALQEAFLAQKPAEHCPMEAICGEAGGHYGVPRVVTSQGCRVIA